MLDFWGAWARQADQASHNPPAASSAAIARDRCFAFICFLIQGDDAFTFATALCPNFGELAFDVAQSREIVVRNASQQERIRSPDDRLHV